jgi:hypothetical protein
MGRKLHGKEESGFGWRGIVGVAATSLVEAEALIEANGRRIGFADFEEDASSAGVRKGGAHSSDECGSQAVATVVGMDGKVEDFGFVGYLATDNKAGDLLVMQGNQKVCGVGCQGFV